MRPLEGLRVVDLTRVLSGPYCTMQLGDMGAEVLRELDRDRPHATGAGVDQDLMARLDLPADHERLPGGQGHERQ